MGIQIVSLFPKECHEADETIDAEIHAEIDAEIHAEIDESLTLEDLLFICGHRALGLSIRQALEINRHYGHEVDRPL